MNACESHVRRRGMFFHVETPELDDVEVESAEGMPARIARRKSPPTARASSAQLQLSPTPNIATTSNIVTSGVATRRGQLQLRRKRNHALRFATATGSRRPSLMSR